MLESSRLDVSKARGLTALFSCKLLLFFGVACLLLSIGLVADACGGAYGDVLRYLGHVVGSVLLPGLVVMNVLTRRRVTLAELLAIGLPCGFAIEITTYVLASALHARGLLMFAPGFWLVALAAAVRFRPAGTSLGLFKPSREDIVVAGVLSLAFMFTAAGRFFVGTPMEGGVLVSSTHHDWVYLLSRAAEIREQWPLQDPSMAGAPLSYHYFFLIHLASSSHVTGAELELIGLRLAILPLGAALIAQAYLLGQTLTHKRRVGAMSALLLIAAGDLSVRVHSGQSLFGNWFLDWLFVSPTFFFGMVFTGALVLWIHRMIVLPWAGAGYWVLLVLLAAAGTGAKGTVVPPLLVAVALFAAADWYAKRRFPIRPVLVCVAMLTGFAGVYFIALREWGSGSAALEMFASLRVTDFWMRFADGWRAGLISFGMSPQASSVLAQVICAVITLVGFLGVHLVALITFRNWKTSVDQPLCLLLAFSCVAYFGFGQAVTLDSQSQLYLWLPIHLPLCALTAAAIRHVYLRLNPSESSVSVFYIRWAIVVIVGVMAVLQIASGAVSLWIGMAAIGCLVAFVGAPANKKGGEKSWRLSLFVLRAVPALAIAAVLGVQFNHWYLRNSTGLRQLRAARDLPPDRDLQLLREGMTWVRSSTPPDAVLVANAFTTRHLDTANIGSVDRTTVDKHFYYSALSGRRFWVEGPTYLRDQSEARRRVEIASRVVFGEPLHPSEVEELRRWSALYVLIDRKLKDGADMALPASSLVYSNDRLAIYRWNTDLPPNSQTTAATLR